MKGTSLILFPEEYTVAQAVDVTQVRIHILARKYALIMSFEVCTMRMLIPVIATNMYIILGAIE